ncbi:aldehyde dehydrogenase family protein [Streptomyces sp. PT12]|uniref:aldehyde dehydrogenase family protein n=1 Tax=Streptomyces sp. PT12 TaxID=1510197 RepID=UPI000DE4C31E|nr:aldehyde dehydrogenase family protein [Streptomyces sp. PT12]RBM06255.1 hypothetical protein DEH69_26680 [Streptomyces sp. PT12]
MTGARAAAWEALHRVWRSGGTAGLATVVATFGSAPRPPGTPMLVTAEGGVVGGVSGGCVDGDVHVRALAAGNAVIQKPSELTPGVGEWLARSWARAVPDLPDVLQSLVGYAATGRALVAAGVDKVAFTGSVRSGRAVAADCAPHLTPLLLELGGDDGVVVAEGADAHTVHALADQPRGARLREAFVAHDAFQRGFCTPGQLMSALAALDRPGLDDPAAIREFMSGNLCRCGAYPNIVAAIRHVRGGHGA